MRRGHSELFETYLRNMQRIYWIEFIEAQTEKINHRAAAALPEGSAKSAAERDCLAATYDYFRYRKAL